MTTPHWRTGASQALRSFGLEKIAGPLDSIDHMAARIVTRMGQTPQAAVAIEKHYQRALLNDRLPSGANALHLPFYGEGKLPAHAFKRDLSKPGLNPASVKGLLQYHVRGGGVQPATALAPDMQPFGSSKWHDGPRAPFTMPSDNLSAYPPASLPKYTDALKNPEEHLALLRHLSTVAPIDDHLVRRHPGLLDTAKRYGLKTDL